MRIPIAREGLPFFAPPLLLGVLLLALGFLPWLGAAFVLLGGAVVLFFRDPDRETAGGEDSIVAPADGRVIRLVSRPGGATELSIFLSPFDVHINRSPVSGKLSAARYEPGRYLRAYDPEAPSKNERIELDIDAEIGPVRMTEITGILVRRIVMWKKPGDRLVRGERIGLMKFGSRIDLLLPPGLQLRVKEGDRVWGAQTVLAEGGT